MFQGIELLDSTSLFQGYFAPFVFVPYGVVCPSKHFVLTHFMYVIRLLVKTMYFATMK
jgi:hypothetical protein